MILVLVNNKVKADDAINEIVKKAIAEAAPQNAKAMPRAVIVESSDLDEVVPVKPTPKIKKTPDCACGPECDCDGCKCKPGYKCDCNGCKKLTKSRSEAPVERCYVIIDDVKIFTIEDMTASEATAAIRAQGSKVVFIDAQNTVVDPPSWYSGKVALSHSMVQQKYKSGGFGGEVVAATPVYAPVPVYTAPPPRTGGLQAGFSWQGPLGGGFSAGACVGGT